VVGTADIIAADMEATAAARVAIRQAGTGAIRRADTMGIQQAARAATRQMVRAGIQRADHAGIQRADRGGPRAYPVAIERQRQDIRRRDNRPSMDRIRRPRLRQRGTRA
jgi:hypothetical protein